MITFEKIATGQGNDYTINFLLDYIYFNKYYKMIAINLNKQQTPGADLKAIQKINFVWNLARDGDANTKIFFIIKESKEIILYFLQGTVKLLWIYFTLL